MARKPCLSKRKEIAQNDSVFYYQSCISLSFCEFGESAISSEQKIKALRFCYERNVARKMPRYPLASSVKQFHKSLFICSDTVYCTKDTSDRSSCDIGADTNTVCFFVCFYVEQVDICCGLSTGTCTKCMFGVIEYADFHTKCFFKSSLNGIDWHREKRFFGRSVQQCVGCCGRRRYDKNIGKHIPFVTDVSHKGSIREGGGWNTRSFEHVCRISGMQYDL